MSRQSLAERIASAVMAELHTQGVCDVLTLSDQEFEAVATRVQDLLDSTADQTWGCAGTGEVMNPAKQGVRVGTSPETCVKDVLETWRDAHGILHARAIMHDGQERTVYMPTGLTLFVKPVDTTASVTNQPASGADDAG